MNAAKAAAGRLRFCVKLTPKAGRDAIDGWATDAAGRAVLKVRVSAPPFDNTANEALVALIARTLEVKRSSIRIVSGETSRTKLVEAVGDRTLLSRLAPAEKAQ